MDAITWPLLERGFNAAGAMNIVATMACGRCFTGAALPAAWPGAFGTEGQAVLVLFGGCYIAAAPSLRPGREKQPWTYAVLCAEKLFFASAWAFWARQQRPSLGCVLSRLLRKDALAALFLAGMGIADLSFAGVFATAAVKAFMEEEKKTKTA